MPSRILVDCDGVLTDGTLTIDHKGEKLFKRFHTRDVRAIRELVHHGFEVVIVTADEWAGTEHFAEKVGAEIRVVRYKGPDPDPYIAVGDDAWDIPMLRGADRAFAPSDAELVVWDVPRIERLDTLGGRGVMAEVLRKLVG